MPGKENLTLRAEEAAADSGSFSVYLGDVPDLKDDPAFNDRFNRPLKCTKLQSLVHHSATIEISTTIDFFYYYNYWPSSSLIW